MSSEQPLDSGINSSDLKVFLANTLDKVLGISVSQHQSYFVAITTKFNDNPKLLVHYLHHSLDVILSASVNLENVINFLVKLATKKEWMDIVAIGIIKRCLKDVRNRDKTVRFRVCDIVGRILDSCRFTELDHELLVRAKNDMLIRLADKIPEIRQRAAFALRYLLDDVDPATRYLKNMIRHDSNKECRLEALKSIQMHRNNLQSIICALDDISPEVRKTSLKRLHQVEIDALSIKERIHILRGGLLDGSKFVKETCKKLLEIWLNHKHGDIIKLLKTLNIEKYEIEGALILKTIFNNKIGLTVDAPPPYLNINGNNFDNEHIFYWKCLIQWYEKQNPIQKQKIEDNMTDTIEFVKLFENPETLKTDFIRRQLFVLAKYSNGQDPLNSIELFNAAIILLDLYGVGHDFAPLIIQLLNKLKWDDDIEVNPDSFQKSNNLINCNNFDDDDFKLKVNIIKQKRMAMLNKFRPLIMNLNDHTTSQWQSELFKPMIENMIIPILTKKKPTRPNGFKPFRLFLKMDEEHNTNNFIIRLHLLEAGGSRAKCCATKRIFIYLLIHDDLFNEEETSSLISTLKEFLQDNDKKLVKYTVEGFKKLLNRNKLKHYKTEIEQRLAKLDENISFDNNLELQTTVSQSIVPSDTKQEIESESENENEEEKLEI
eukprot:464931_1